MTKLTHRVVPSPIATTSLVNSLVGLCQAFFYSWLVTVSIDMSATAKAHNDSLARLGDMRHAKWSAR